MHHKIGLASELRHQDVSRAKVAFGEIYKSYQAVLYLIAKKIVKDPTEAEDLASGTLLKLWEKRFDIKNDKHLAGYLKLTLIGSCLKLLDRQQLKNQLSHNLQNISEQAPVISILQNLDIYKRAMEIVETMPRQTGEVCRLLLQDMSPEEIAEKLGITLETARTQASRARKILDNKLRKSPDSDAYLMLLFLYYMGSTYSA
jgi:RNA polymerase sigma-70 factor (ECF subfamily)